MFALTIKNLLANKMRLVSTAMAVLIGVAFMAGTLVFTDTLSATFDGVLSDANSGVDAMVRVPEQVDLSYGQTGARIDVGAVEPIEQVDGVAQVETRVSGYAQLIGPDGEPVGDQAQAPAFGYNWVPSEVLNPFELVEGRAPVTDDEIVIDQASADKAGYRVGDVTPVLTGDEPQTFTITGIATYGGADSQAGATAVLFTQRMAEELLAQPGQVDGIVVTARDGVTQEDLAASLEAALGDDLEVVTGAQLIAEDQAAFDESFGPFKTFLLVFAAVSVFVGAFIINNTFSITVAHRSKEMAMLRALGATRRQVLRTVLIEAVVTGVFASGVGIVAGIGVARALRVLLVGFGIELPDGPAIVNPASMLIAFGIGVVVTVLSAVLPARRAAGILPIAAMRDVAIESTTGSVRRAIIGLLVTAAGGGLLLAGLGGAGISLVGAGALVSFVGVAVLGPVAARPVSRLVGAPVRVTGVSGELATGNAERNPKRTARTASSLMVGVGLVAFVTVFGASVKTSFAGSIEDNYHGSHVVSSGVFDGRGGLSPHLADDLRASPGVETVSAARSTPAVVGGKETGWFEAFDAEDIGQLFDLGSVEGDLGLGTDGIAVTTERAAAESWTLGSTVPVVLPTGPVDFTVQALFEGSEWFGDAFVDVAAFEAHLPGSLDYRVYVFGDGDAVAAAAQPYPTADVLDRDAFFDDTSGEIDQVLGVIYAMLALAVLIALLGVANTLSLSVFERTREIGLLRAVGMTRRQIRSTILGEAVIVALFGTVGGIGVGTVFGWATVHALADQGIDTLTLPYTRLMVITAVAAIAGALAATLPARRAARLQILDALATQ